MNLCWLPPVVVGLIIIIMTSVVWRLSLVVAAQVSADAVRISRSRSPKKSEQTSRDFTGAKEWFMLIDVTPENAVIPWQEKYHDRYRVDESETHDRPMTSGEVQSRSQTPSTA